MIEFYYNPTKDETTVYVWNGQKLTAATTYKGEMTKDEKTQMRKDIKNDSNKR